MKSNKFIEKNLQVAQELTVLGIPRTGGVGRGTKMGINITRIPFPTPGC